jgi:hypothetical protein
MTARPALDDHRYAIEPTASLPWRKSLHSLAGAGAAAGAACVEAMVVLARRSSDGSLLGEVPGLPPFVLSPARVESEGAHPTLVAETPRGSGTWTRGSLDDVAGSGDDGLHTVDLSPDTDIEGVKGLPGFATPPEIKVAALTVPAVRTADEVHALVDSLSLRDATSSDAADEDTSLVDCVTALTRLLPVLHPATDTDTDTDTADHGPLLGTNGVHSAIALDDSALNTGNVDDARNVEQTLVPGPGWHDVFDYPTLVQLAEAHGPGSTVLVLAQRRNTVGHALAFHNSSDGPLVIDPLADALDRVRPAGTDPQSILALPALARGRFIVVGPDGTTITRPLGDEHTELPAPSTAQALIDAPTVRTYGAPLTSRTLPDEQQGTHNGVELVQPKDGPAWDGQSLVDLFESKKGLFSDQQQMTLDGFNSDLVDTALDRMRNSSWDYGRLDPSVDQHLVLLFHEVNKHLMPPREAVPVAEEEHTSLTEAIEQKQTREDYLQQSPDESEDKASTYDLAVLGAGAASAYYLMSTARELDKSRTIVIGELQPWKEQRGPGVINHPMHMITPARDQVGLADEALAPREDFSEVVEKVIQQSGTQRRQEKVELVTKVTGQNGAKFYRVDVEGDPKPVFARRIVAGFGIGPHNRAASQEAPLEVHGGNRAMDMDEFQKRAGSFIPEEGDAKDVTVVISGGNAAIDSAMTAIKSGFTIVWITGSKRPALLPGTDNEVVEAEYDKLKPNGTLPARLDGGALAAGRKGPGVLENPESKIKTVVLGYAENAVLNPEHGQGSEKPLLVNVTGAEPIKADYFVYAMGPNINQVRNIFDKESVRDQLVPTYDRNRQFRADGPGTVIGLEARKQPEDQTSLEIIGGTALRIGDQVDYDWFAQQWHEAAGSADDLAALTTRFDETSGSEQVQPVLDAMRQAQQKVSDYIRDAQGAATGIRDASRPTDLSRPAFPDLTEEEKALGAELPPTLAPVRDAYLSNLRSVRRYAGQLDTHVEKVQTYLTNRANDRRFRGADPRKAASQMGAVLDSLPLNVAVNDQLTPVRSQVEAAQGFVPDYVTDDVNFATDSATVMQLYISSRFPHISDKSANDWVDLITRLRRPTTADRNKYEELYGPLPDPQATGRPSTRDYSDWFKQRLGDANEQALSALKLADTAQLARPHVQTDSQGVGWASSQYSARDTDGNLIPQDQRSCVEVTVILLQDTVRPPWAQDASLS